MIRIKFPYREYILPIVLGLSDGILTVLTFAANLIMDPKKGVSLGLSLRISLAAVASGSLVYFLSQYAELRNQLIHSEKELNLMKHGKLATTRLGRAVIKDAIKATIIASISAFMGAFLPLLIAVFIAKYHWVPIVTALASLGILGFGLARAVYGNPWRWALILVISGIVLWLIGLKLQIV